MTFNGWLQILVYFGLILALAKPVGLYLHRVFESPDRPLPRVFGPVERALHRLCGVDPDQEQNWRQYLGSLLAFSLLGGLVTFLLLLTQHRLPLNPQGFDGLSWDLAFNTAVSFLTNTNWQSYSGENTMSHLSQMVALTWHNFVSAGAGVAVALAVARGLTRKDQHDGLGNFWADLIRSLVYVFVPACLVVALVLVSQGVIQNFSPDLSLTTLEGGGQPLAMGPVASQEAIKMLGTNGGGFFNANSSHPFENPTPFSNLLEMLCIFVIPAGLTYAYGRMARDQRQGWVLFGAMALLFLAGSATAYWAESHPNPALSGLAIEQPVDGAGGVSPGNMEGKEVRFGVPNSALFATVTTDASCGAVNSMHDSFTPLGGLVPLVNIQLGEVIFGGVGAGLYGMLVFVLLSVFIAGLMVGRTPEYLGKKVEAREMQMAMVYVLIFPLVILGGAAWAAVDPVPLGGLANAGPHGLTEILYAFSSAAGNNGSAFAGLSANAPWWNVSLGLAMLLGRFAMIAPVMALAGGMAVKRTVPPGPGTFPTNGGLFLGLLTGVILIVGALTFFPVLSLGPVLEAFLAPHGKLF
jgi:K+-transporting ATPase ATPase A chain